MVKIPKAGFLHSDNAAISYEVVRNFSVMGDYRESKERCCYHHLQSCPSDVNNGSLPTHDDNDSPYFVGNTTDCVGNNEWFLLSYHSAIESGYRPTLCRLFYSVQRQCGLHRANLRKQSVHLNVFFLSHLYMCMYRFVWVYIYTNL